MLDWINKENINAKDYASTYKGESVMYEGIATYKDESVFLSKDTLKKCMPNLKGRPVIIEHKLGIKPDNMEKYAVGYVTDCKYNNETGDFDCDFVTWNDEAKELLKNGYTLSTSYIPKEFGNGGTFINTPYDKEIKDLNFTHLAIVKNPRYEKAKVYMNSTEELNNDKWITKFDKEGEPYHVNIDPSDDFKKGENKTHEDKEKQEKAGFEKEKKYPNRLAEILYKDLPELREKLHKARTERAKQKEKGADVTFYDKKIKEYEDKEQKLKDEMASIRNNRRQDKDRYISLIEEKEQKYRQALKLKGNKPENQNDINEEKENYCMDKIEVEQGFLKSLLDRVSKTLEFSNANDEEEILAAEKAAKEAEEKAKAEEEAEKAAREKENSVDWFEKMQEVMNSNDGGEADKIKPAPNSKSALEKGKKIFG